MSLSKRISFPHEFIEFLILRLKTLYILAHFVEPIKFGIEKRDRIEILFKCHLVNGKEAQHCVSLTITVVFFHRSATYHSPFKTLHSLSLPSVHLLGRRGTHKALWRRWQNPKFSLHWVRSLSLWPRTWKIIRARHQRVKNQQSCWKETKQQKGTQKGQKSLEEEQNQRRRKTKILDLICEVKCYKKKISL